MKDIKATLDLIVVVVGILGAFYRLAKIEQKIYETIENVKDSLLEKINTNANQIDKYIAIRSEKDEWAEYLRHALDEKIDHKFNRLHEQVKELKLEIKELKELQ
ncbi:MAG: hypothetical protein C6Y22_17535 [Hapalosiphonaceae cyanobacterium JJU2]|nr:MAG: hypothetical protein C6Y22_17535 [Hapalosiphonaceae cyanobacterium JJU2]